MLDEREVLQTTTTPAIIKVVVVSNTSRSSSLSPSISAEAKFEIRSSAGRAAHGDHFGGVVAPPFEGGEVLGPLGRGCAGRSAPSRRPSRAPVLVDDLLRARGGPAPPSARGR